jgi:spore germination cell wall hydrolase CwlJ-like protein
MKVIISETQFKYILENTNPCPEGTKEDELITLQQIKDGKIIEKGYCNAGESSAIVKIQKMLQDKNLLDTKSNNGYYGNKTQEAIKKLWEPDEVKGTQIGKKTVEKLEGKKEEKKEKEVSEKKEFNDLSEKNKKIVCTLLGEAGGESDPYKSMQAVANVLKNRADNNFMNNGSSVESQALANKQFSMWNKYNSGGEKLQDVYNKYKNHKQLTTAISIAENIGGLSDVTQGAQFYYANYVKPYWTKDTDTTKWVPTVTIGNHKFGNVVKKKKK